MDIFTQTSICGCSRKHSTVSLASKYQRRHSVRSLALQPVAVEFDNGRESGSISVASLHIQALRPPENLSSAASDTDDRKSQNRCDYVHDDRVAWKENGSECQPENRSIVRIENDGTTGVRFAIPNPRDGSITQGQATESHANRVVSRNTPNYVSYGFSSNFVRRDKTALQNDVNDFSRHNATASPGLDSIVTHGRFVSRRPSPAARSKTELRQEQKMDRERCRSGATPSAGPQSKNASPAVRARRGNSAGDIKYCGRPCDACSLQKLQQWARCQQFEENDSREASKKLYVTTSASSQRKQQYGGSSGGHLAEAIPVTRVSMPGRGLPKLTGLQHELDDPSCYEHPRQDHTHTHPQQQSQGHKGSHQDTRPPVPHGHRQGSVVHNRDMLRHVRLGSQHLNAPGNHLDVLSGDCKDLLESILLYEIPGVSKMKNDYTGLVGRPGGEKSNSPGDIVDITSAGTLGDGLLLPAPSFPPQQPQQLFPSLLPGQRLQ